MIVTEVRLAFLLNGSNAQRESDGDKGAGEGPLKDPVGGEPKASGDPCPGSTNEDSTEGEDEEEGDGHNYGVCREHPLSVCEGNLIFAVATAGCSIVREGECHCALVIVLGDGAAWV